MSQPPDPAYTAFWPWPHGAASEVGAPGRRERRKRRREAAAGAGAEGPGARGGSGEAPAGGGAHASPGTGGREVQASWFFVQTLGARLEIVGFGWGELAAAISQIIALSRFLFFFSVDLAMLMTQRKPKLATTAILNPL